MPPEVAACSENPVAQPSHPVVAHRGWKVVGKPRFLRFSVGYVVSHPLRQHDVSGRFPTCQKPRKPTAVPGLFVPDRVRLIPMSAMNLHRVPRSAGTSAQPHTPWSPSTAQAGAARRYAEGARQHQPAGAAILRSAVEPAGQHLAVASPELPLQPRLRHPRHDRRRMFPRLEQPRRTAGSQNPRSPHATGLNRSPPSCFVLGWAGGWLRRQDGHRG